MSTLSYRPDLDGLRSIAVYLVLGFHAHLALLEGGFVGVDLFFVLSGFLVTGVLLRDVRTEGHVRLGRFYARRVRRLLPAALVVIVATCLLQLLVASLPARLELVDDARASTLYFANWHFITESRDYFAQDEAASPFLHFWSLSIEEQFYIVFPVVVLAVARWSRRPVRVLAVVLGAVTAASVVAQVVTAAADPNLAYYATHTRIYQLAAGGLLMTLLLARDGRAERESSRRRTTTTATAGSVAAVAGLAVVLGVASSAADLEASTRGLLVTAGSVLAIAGLWSAPRGPLARLLALPIPRYLGQISYGTYLWHWPVTLVVQRVFDTSAVVDALLTAVVATGLAALSFRVLETPIRSARPLHGVPWLVVLGGLTTSVLVVATVLPPVLDHDVRPAVASERAASAPGATGGAALQEPVPAGLDLVTAEGDYGVDTKKPCTVEQPDACVAVDGAGDGSPHVLLLGDSQANTFVSAFEALAEERGMRLSTNVRSGCPWQAGQVNVSRDNPKGQEKCVTLRDEFFADVLPLMDVDVVVAIGLSRSDAEWADRLSSPGGPPDESLAALQDRTTRETADLITAAGARLVIVHSVFGTDGYDLDGFDPIECLATADTLGECAVVAPPRQPTVDDTYGVLDTESPDVATIDLTSTVCPDYPVCRPVVDGDVVWMNTDHVTQTFWHAQREGIWEQLAGTGYFS